MSEQKPKTEPQRADFAGAARRGEVWYNAHGEAYKPTFVPGGIALRRHPELDRRSVTP